MAISKESSFYLIPIFFILIMAIIFLYLPQDQKGNALADCLNEKEAVLLYSNNCPWCGQQIIGLGDTFALIETYECSKHPKECEGLPGVPVWRIGDEIYPGYKEIDELKALVGCE